MKLSTYRKQAGLTQTDLADRLGIGQAAISAYERGDRALTLSRAREIIDVFRAEGVAVTYDDLLPSEGEKTAA